jgi:DNA-binding NarL/FixJ family response regulator
VDDIAVVEAAYRYDLGPKPWLDGVLDASGILRQLGKDILAFEYDANGPIPSWLVSVGGRGGGAGYEGVLTELFAHGDMNVLQNFYQHVGPVSGLPPAAPFSAVFPAVASDPTLASYLGAQAVNELVLFNATDGTGRGVFACISELIRPALHPRVKLRLERVAAHVATGARLRRIGNLRAAAVLSSEGRLLHAEGAAKRAGRSLREAAVRIDRVRSRRTREAEDESLSAWSALIDGRWSLVDRFESDGKRFVVAVENPPGVADPRHLTPMERRVAQLAAHGHAYKLIAYELGMSVGTVGAYLSSATRKLGLRSRTALVDEVCFMNKVRIARSTFGEDTIAVAAAVPDGPVIDGLSDAERATVTAAVRGLSNEEISAKRGVTTRTVANQLAAAYRKLGVHSRAELAARMSGSKRPCESPTRIHES